MGNLTLVGKVVIFKTLTISKIVFQPSITTVPRHIVNEPEKNVEGLSSLKIKHALCNNYKGGGLKNTTITTIRFTNGS